MAKDQSSNQTDAYRYQALIEKRLSELSTAEKGVAAHLTAHPEQLPFETAYSLAKRLGVSAMTVGRTLKAIGYRGLADLRAELRSEVSSTVPWGPRGTPKVPPSLKNLDRARALRAELESIEAVHALAGTPGWQQATQLIANADRVFVAGFQTERGVAVVFSDQLAYVRPGVRHLTIYDRAFADLSSETRTGSCVLVLIDCRRYSRWFRVLAEKATTLGVPLVIATDAYCSWAAKLTPCALHARTDSGRFWDNNAPILSLLNLLTEDVIERLGDTVHSQLDASSEFGAAFVGFERVHRRRAQHKGGSPRLDKAKGRAASELHKGARSRSR